MAGSRKPPARKSGTPRRLLTTSVKKAANKRALVALSDLVARQRLGRRLAGIQYNGHRDINQVAGYVAQGEEQFSHYWGLYKRGDIAGRIVDMPAKTTWRTPPTLVELSDTKKEASREETKFTKAFTEMAKRLRLWHYFERADRLAGVGCYSVVFIGVRGVPDNQLAQPLEKVRHEKDIIYLSVYSENNAEIVEWETDTGNPRFGQPKIYRLKTAAIDQKQFQDAELRVHASRVLHIAEDPLEDDVYGRPRLERCLNRLFDLEKVAASTGESYWQAVARILQAKINPEVEVSQPDLDKLNESLGEMVHDLRRQFYGQGVELEWLNTTQPNPSEVSDFYFSLLAGAAGIPKRILFGSEMGELASTTDQANYLGQINERQEQFAEPSILRNFVDRMILIGALPQPATKEYHVVWPTLFEETQVAKAEANLKRAQTASALTPIGGDPRDLVEIDEEGTVKLIPRAAPDPDAVTEPPDTSEIPEPGVDGSDPADLPPDGE